MLAFGLAIFLYLLQTGYISHEDFSVKKFKGDTEFEIRKNPDAIGNAVKKSDIYAIIRDKEYKIFSFEGDDFNKIYKYQFIDTKYKIPVEALDAVTGVWIGNRYVFYILEKKDENGQNTTYEIYKAEYPTDQLEKLQYFKIKVIEESEFTNKVEVKY